MTNHAAGKPRETEAAVLPLASLEGLELTQELQAHEARDCLKERSTPQASHCLLWARATSTARVWRRAASACQAT